MALPANEYLDRLHGKAELTPHVIPTQTGSQEKQPAWRKVLCLYHGKQTKRHDLHRFNIKSDSK